jgi:hypothetical protein
MLVSQAKGSIFKRTDGKYFVYVPTRLAEDTAFPFPIGESATKINISFKPGDKKLTIEKFRKK